MEELQAGYMKEALLEAQKAYEIREVPIGAVIVYQDAIISRAFNQRNTLKNPLAHAEIIAINQAANEIGDWRLSGCTLYVTLEPCPMCAGAIVSARIPALVFGTENKKAGCCGTILNIAGEPKFNHQVQLTSGIMADECAQILRDFFKTLRA